MSGLTITLMRAELKALLTCAGDGFEGIGHDPAAIRAYLGGYRGLHAAGRAIDKLKRALKS